MSMLDKLGRTGQEMERAADRAFTWMKEAQWARAVEAGVIRDSHVQPLRFPAEEEEKRALYRANASYGWAKALMYTEASRVAIDPCWIEVYRVRASQHAYEAILDKASLDGLA